MSDPDDLARLAYLALLGAFILLGVLGMYRGRMSKALRDGALWLLIILGFVTLYGFKDTLRGALLPSVAVVSDGEIGLRRAADGHFRAIVEVNGAALEFVVDTGASSIVLTKADARRAGLDPDRLDYTIRARTANGIVLGAPVRLDEIRFGGMTLRDVRAVVNDGELFSSLLGMDFLDRFGRITVEGDRLTLEP